MGKKERDKRTEMPTVYEAIQPDLPFAPALDPLPPAVAAETHHTAASEIAEYEAKLFEQADLLEQRKIGGLDNLFAVVRELRRLYAAK